MVVVVKLNIVFVVVMVKIKYWFDGVIKHCFGGGEMEHGCGGGEFEHR